MAKLEDIMPELENEQKTPLPKKTKAMGRKRRAWLEDNNNPATLHSVSAISKQNEAENTNQTGTPINTINQYGSSTPFINPVDQTLRNKGAIKEAHRPNYLSLADLRSNPLQLIRFLHALTKNENEHKNTNDDYKTRRLRLREIMQQLDISKDSARTALRFLLKQNIIFRIEFKPGRLGWSCYSINSSIYQEIEKALLKGAINPFIFQDVTTLEKGFNSSSNFNNITTNNVDHIDWEEVDITSLESIGFSQTQIKQLVGKNTPEVVQESINHFAYALQNNPNTKKYTQNGKNPINVLMGVLRKGGNWFDPNYVSPKDKALRELVERKKLEKENREGVISELMSLEFEDWRKSLTEDEIKKIVPETGCKNIVGLQAPKTVALQAYYKNEILIPRLKRDGLL